MGRDLISKTAAGGLSAGIFLLWWPGHLPADGLGWLVIRGVAWTLVFEALLLAFVPLERMLCRGVRVDRLRGLRARVEAAPARVRAGAALALAFAGLAAPAALLADGGTGSAVVATAGEPKVVRVVHRPVVKREVVVRKVTAPPAYPTAAPAAAAPPATAGRPAVVRSSTPAPGAGVRRPTTGERRDRRRTRVEPDSAAPATPPPADPPVAAAPEKPAAPDDGESTSETARGSARQVSPAAA